MIGIALALMLSFVFVMAGQWRYDTRRKQWLSYLKNPPPPPPRMPNYSNMRNCTINDIWIDNNGKPHKIPAWKRGVNAIRGRIRALQMRFRHSQVWRSIAMGLAAIAGAFTGLSIPAFAIAHNPGLEGPQSTLQQSINNIPLTPTITVYASNSYDQIYQGEWRCTGANDQITINSAISALPAQGGKIVLSEGTYNIDTLTGPVNDRGVDYYYGIGIGHLTDKCSITIEGATRPSFGSAPGYLPDGGVIIKVSAAAYAAGWGAGGKPVGLYALPGETYVGRNITLKNLCVTMPAQDHASACIDLFNVSGMTCENVNAIIDKSPATLIVPGVVVEGIVGLTASKNFDFTLKSCYTRGMYYGFHMDGEHLLMQGCMAQYCVFPYYIGASAQHANALINCGIEHCQCLVELRSGVKTLVDIINMSIEEDAAGTWQQVVYSRELNPGYNSGICTYRISLGGVASSHPFWASGHGVNYRSINGGYPINLPLISTDFAYPSSTTSGIQEAINALPATGGEVFIPAGTHNASAKVTIPVSNVRLYGAGASTILATTAGAPLGDDFIYATGKSNLIVENLQILGTNQTAGYGINFAGAGVDCLIRKVKISGCFSGPILTAGSVGPRPVQSIQCYLAYGTTNVLAPAFNSTVSATAQPDAACGRNLILTKAGTAGAGGQVIVTGKDQFGNVVTETTIFAGGAATTVGTKIFASIDVNGIVISALTSGDMIAVGLGNKVGLDHKIFTGAVKKVFKSGVGNYALTSITEDVTYHGITVADAIAANDEFQITSLDCLA